MLLHDLALNTIFRAYTTLFSLKQRISGALPLPAGRKIIAVNHTLASDVVFVKLALKERARFLVQGDLFQFPVFGMLIKDTGHIAVHAGERQNSFKEACEALSREETVVIFPEGRLVPFGERVQASTGAVRMSLATGAPIVPLGVYVSPSNLSTVKLRWNGRTRQALLQFKGDCNLRFGPPWKPAQDSNRQAHCQLQTKALMDLIYSLVSEARKESECESHTSLNPIRQW